MPDTPSEDEAALMAELARIIRHASEADMVVRGPAVTLPVTRAEYDALRLLAQRRMISVSELVRELLMDELNGRRLRAMSDEEIAAEVERLRRKAEEP